eukprot:jgi/Tetstr1/447033/TSEL_034490.t1
MAALQSVLSLTASVATVRLPRRSEARMQQPAACSTVPAAGGGRRAVRCRATAPESRTAVRPPIGGSPQQHGGESPRAGPRWDGYAELVAVSMLWGTYNPTLKLIYAEDHPLDPSTLTAIRTALSAGALITAAVWQARAAQEPAAVGQEGDEAAAGAAGPLLRREPDRRGPLAYSFVSVVPAGVELGLYNFLGTATQAMGVQQVSATRASFLVQTISLLVPAITFLGGEQISGKVWAAIGVGLAGSCLVAWDGLHASAADLAAAGGADELQGLGLVMASCLFYSLAVVRLGTYAPRHNSIDLTAVKKITLSTASAVWFANGVHAIAGGAPLGDGASWTAQLEALGVLGRPAASYALIVFSALGPGAGATFLQTRGQSALPATAAQVIYSLTPLWSALAASVVLGDEGLGPASWAGGGLVLGASLLSALAQAERPPSPPQDQKRQA